MSVILLIIGLILFVGLVVVHEFGHFIVARRNNVEVEEFGVGFPPRAKVLTRKNGTTYTINWLPLGGFVKLKGEHDSDTQEGSYGAASLKAKSKIMMAGVGMNLGTAFVILTLLALLGMPKLIDNQTTMARDTKVIRNDVYVGYIEPNSPAEKAGLQLRDRIVTLGKDSDAICQQNNVEDVGCVDTTVKDITSLQQLGSHYGGQTVMLGIERGSDRLMELKVTLRTMDEVEASLKTDNPEGYLGISPTEYTLQRSTWSAPLVAAALIKQFTVLTFQGLGKALGGLFTGHPSEASAQVAGPVGIFVLLKDGSELGYQFILMIIAIISLTLAIMNALPIPALDGGRLFVTWLYRALKRPLTKRREDAIHGTGFAVLMVLFVLITIVDIKRNF